MRVIASTRQERGALLGAIPKEDLDLVLRPQLQSIKVNLESPKITLSVAQQTSAGRINL